MKITFSARHFDATDKLRKFATEEAASIENHFENVSYIDIILEENGANKSVEIRTSLLGKVFTAKNEDTDFYKMIPKAMDKLEAQMRTAKAKAQGR